MSKPRLTEKVLRGLAVIAGTVQAADCAQLLGNDETDPETRETWRDVLRACEWIEAMQLHREGDT